MRKTINLVGNVSSVLVAVATLTAALLGISQYLEDRGEFQLAGEWEMRFIIEETTYRPFKGMEVGYKVFVSQNKSEITILGEKWWLNGEEIPYSDHVQIEFSGVLSGSRLPLSFTLHGAKRKTVGFVEGYLEDESNMKGTFSNTGGNSSGSVLMRKVSI